MIIGLKNLCEPAEFYLVISLIFTVIVVIFHSNITNNVYCLGLYDCKLSSNMIGIVFVIKLIYIAFWTWVLNILCRTVSSSVAWILAIFPFVLFLGLIGYGVFTRV